MDRRKFLIGMGALTAGGAAALGTGAFSRVESQRHVSIQVAQDPDAYLGLKLLDTPNSNNYVELDEKGHLTIDIDESGNEGYGVNSDSFTWFDGMFEICNQGKADAMISYELPDVEEAGHPSFDGSWEAPHGDYDEQAVGFYYIATEEDADPVGTRVFVEEGQEVPLELGDCVEIGVRTVTKSIDATIDEPLIDGEIVVTADSPGAGQQAD